MRVYAFVHIVGAGRPRNVGKHPPHVLRTRGGWWTDSCQHAKVGGGRGRDLNKGLARTRLHILQRTASENPQGGTRTLLRACGGCVGGDWCVELQDTVGEHTHATTCDGGHMSNPHPFALRKGDREAGASTGRVTKHRGGWGSRAVAGGWGRAQGYRWSCRVLGYACSLK